MKDEIKARLAAVIEDSPLPWKAEEDAFITGYMGVVDADEAPVITELDSVYEEDVSVLLDKPLAEFIAAAPTDIQWLFQRLEELETENKKLKLENTIIKNTGYGQAVDDAEDARRDLLLVEMERNQQKEKIIKIGELLAAHGCECECDHHPEEHAADCERCIGCRVGAIAKEEIV